MSLVDLTGIRLAHMVPMPVTFGQSQRPSSGGQAFRVDRLGNRWSFQCETPMMRLEPDGGLWDTDLGLASRLGGTVRIKQPNFAVGAPGNPTVAADTDAGRVIPLAGLTPGYAIRKRQWVSIISGGRRYLDRVTENAIAGSDGTVSITTMFLIREPMLDGDLVELGAPKIEGSIEVTNPFDWNVDRLTSCAFTITEDA